MQFTVVDDEILELTEGFLAVFELQSAMYPDLIDFDDSRLTLIRIRDDDSEGVMLLDDRVDFKSLL